MTEFRPFDNGANAPYAQLGLRFAQALSSGDYKSASAMLTPTLRAAYPPEILSQRYRDMVGEDASQPDLIEVITTMTEWPDKLIGDIGWVYVAIAGHMYSEAVTCIVVGNEGLQHIRSIEWGRP